VTSGLSISLAALHNQRPSVLDEHLRTGHPVIASGYLDEVHGGLLSLLDAALAG
jgi:hypothetical protein